MKPRMEEDLRTAAAVEATVALPGFYEDLHAAFRLSRAEASAAGASDDALLWEEWIHGLHLKPEAAPIRETVLVPALEIVGRPPYPPPVAEFPVEAGAYFAARRAQTRFSSVRARIADFLWHGSGDVTHARDAASDYLDTVVDFLAVDDGILRAAEPFARGATLALTLRHDEPKLIRVLRAYAAEAIEEAGLHLSNLIAVCERLLRRDQALATGLLEDVVGKADALAATGGQRRYFERMLLENAADLARIAGDHERMTELRRRIPASFEAEAEERSEEGGIVQIALLQPALKLYSDLGVPEAVERLKAKLHTASERSMGEMTEHTFSFEIPRAKIRAQLDEILSRSLQVGPSAHLQVLATNPSLWPDWDSVRQRTAEFKAEHPIQFLVQRTHIGPDGRPLPEPEDREAAELFHEIGRYTEDFQLTLVVYSLYVEELRARGLWTEHLLMTALGGGALFTDEILEAVRPGIRAFEEGRIWEAVHVLVACIERVVRRLALSLGVDVYRYKSGTGEIHWASLTELLSEPKVEQTLGLIRADFGRLLRYLLTDSRSLNLRDDLAHGITPPSAVGEQTAMIPLLILLHLSAFRLGGDAGNGEE